MQTGLMILWSNAVSTAYCLALEKMKKTVKSECDE